MFPKVRLSLFLVLCLFLPFCADGLFAFSGESITYVIRPVGKAEYRDLGSTELDGKKVNLSTFQTKVFNFDDTEKIFSDPKSSLPLRVERYINMWPNKEYLVETYNQGDFSLKIEKFVKQKKVREYAYTAKGPVYNAVLLPFSLRNLSRLDVGWTMLVNLPAEFTVKIVAIEEIEVPAGKFRAYHFTSNPDKFEIWISCDELRLPLKIKDTSGMGYTFLMKERRVQKR